MSVFAASLGDDLGLALVDDFTFNFGDDLPFDNVFGFGVKLLGVLGSNFTLDFVFEVDVGVTESSSDGFFGGGAGGSGSGVEASAVDTAVVGTGAGIGDTGLNLGFTFSVFLLGFG